MTFDIETYYARCEALFSAIDKVDGDERDALLWILEDEFKKLGEAIGKGQTR